MRRYQILGSDFVYERNAAYLDLQMGAGKTLLTIDALRGLLDDGVVSRVLILAPLRVCKYVWPEEANKLGESVALAVGTPAQRAAAIESEANIVVANYDVVTKLDLSSFDCLVPDEITKLKSSKTARWKVLKKHRKQFKIVIALSGTPISESLLDAWAQLWLLDPERCKAVLGGSFAIFRQKYFEQPYPNSYTWNPKLGTAERIAELFREYTFTISPEEYARQLPEFRSVPVRFDLGAATQVSYDEMERDYLVAVDRGEVIAGSEGVLTNKLRQLASGFLYLPEGGAKVFGRDRLDTLAELLEELGDAHALICYNFIEEAEQIQERFPDVAVPTDESLATWDRGELQRLLIHPASAGHGLNLQDGGHTLIWYSLPWSSEQFAQTRARLHRGGQEHPVTEYVLEAAGTVDEEVFRALEAKRNVLAELRRLRDLRVLKAAGTVDADVLRPLVGK